MTAGNFPRHPDDIAEMLDWTGEEVVELFTAHVTPEPVQYLPEPAEVLAEAILNLRQKWMDQGTCRLENAPRKYFILDDGVNARKARTYCARCPVRERCLEYGLSTGSVGVWGGEVLTLSNREEVELSDLRIQDARPVHLEYLDNPPPLMKHQLPPVIFFKN